MSTVKQERLLNSITKDYLPTGYHSGWLYWHRLPPFTLFTVGSMLMDARVLFGLWLIKGPILAQSRFKIECENTVVKDFIISNITRFWMNGAARALKALEWGYSCSEVMYDLKDDGLIHYKDLKTLHATDCRALTEDGELIGARIRNVPGRGRVTIAGPKMLWHIHQREYHPFYGRSRLFGAYYPWTETWTDGGFRDVRRLYFHKYAFDGGTMYHPQGSTKLEESGASISYKDLARELLEKRKTGGTLTLPNIVDGQGVRQWEYVAPTMATAPVAIMEYGADLKTEILEGMGIPPEVAAMGETGAYAGRLVPQQAFYASLQEMVRYAIGDFDEQVLCPLIELNYGSPVEHEIKTFGLMQEDAKEEGLDGGVPLAPGQQDPLGVER